MRIRSLLFVAALATAALGVGASGASAATLFTTTAHTARVTVGATVTITSETNLDWTLPKGTVANRCTTVDLHATLEENSHTRVSFRITNGSFGHCTPSTITPTFTPPWTLTIFGNATVLPGGITSYHSTIDNFAAHFGGLPGPIAGNLENLTVTQPTVGTSPLTLRTDTSCGLLSPIGNFCLDGNFRFDDAAAAWSLTN